MTRPSLHRRAVLACFLCLPVRAYGADQDDYLDFLFRPMRGGVQSPPTTNAERSTRQQVRYQTAEPVGSIVIDTATRRLYLIEKGGLAQQYQVGIGSEGYGWTGAEKISAKREWPDWRPPQDMRARRPDLPAFMPGGPQNPLGARALYLGQTLYRIHGSNDPASVGTAASAGCFRMTNTDVIDLYGRVRIGANVRVL